MFLRQKTTQSDFITVALGCCGETREYKADTTPRAKNSGLGVARRRGKPLECFLPISSIRRWSDPGWRKVSSLHERICVPTSSEFVASILALSSFRFTPAMEATSLMSSSSLHQISVGIRRQKNGNIRLPNIEKREIFSLSASKSSVRRQ